MKYILNTGRYARGFTIVKPNGKLNREVKITLDRRRLYTDTGNVATTGITAISDEDFELLQKNEAFAQMFKDKSNGLTLVDESMVTGETDKRASELEEENKKLREELAKAKKQSDKNEDAEAVQKIKDENAKLKAQLEALNGKKDKEADKADKADKADEKAEDEGF